MMLSEADHRRVAEAVVLAEAKTTGEIFCIVSNEVSQYREIPLAYASAAALILPPLAAAFGFQFWILSDASARLLNQANWSSLGWHAQEAQARVFEAITAYAVVQAILFALVALVVSVPTIRRALTPQSLKRHRVRRTAYAHFASTGLAGDLQRTGVLIFASLQDRQVEIVADKGIHDAVGDAVWDKATAELVNSMKKRAPGQGFVNAIGVCGSALAEHYPSDGPHDSRFSDELIEV